MNNILIEKVNNGYIVKEEFNRYSAEIPALIKTKVFESELKLCKYIRDNFNLNNNEKK